MPRLLSYLIVSGYYQTSLSADSRRLCHSIVVAGWRDCRYLDFSGQQELLIKVYSDSTMAIALPFSFI